MSRDLPRFDVLVVGGGPAGIAAAVRAGQSGMRVGIIDDNMSLGGQIWRGAARGGTSEATRWCDLLGKAQVTVLRALRVFDQPEAGVVRAEGPDGYCAVRFTNLVLATGARERFLPFPGWTLPHVMGAGGLQAMVKGGLPIRGKRVVVAGSGPLLLAVAAYVRKQGAEVPIICEQASWSSLARFGTGLLWHPAKIVQAVQLKRDLAGIPLATNSWVLAARGERKVEEVTILRKDQRATIACDYVACGFHLVPNTELAELLGCRLSSGFVQVDEMQQTTVPGIFCAGEPTGIGGLELSLVEGEIAGFAVVGRSAEARKLLRRRAAAQRFARGLDRAFALRRELARLASPQTIVCRCEDVTLSRLQEHASWRAAKLHTRCGMGPCQGRICGPATEFLLDWDPGSVRPPVFPVSVESLALATSPVRQEAVPGGDQ